MRLGSMDLSSFLLMVVVRLEKSISPSIPFSDWKRGKSMVISRSAGAFHDRSSVFPFMWFLK